MAELGVTRLPHALFSVAQVPERDQTTPNLVLVVSCKVHPPELHGGGGGGQLTKRNLVGPNPQPSSTSCSDLKQKSKRQAPTIFSWGKIHLFSQLSGQNQIKAVRGA